MEFGRQYEVWPCPFCSQETISVVRFPKSVSVKTSRTASLPGGKGFHVNPDIYLISTGCSKRGRLRKKSRRNSRRREFSDGRPYLELLSV